MTELSHKELTFVDVYHIIRRRARVFWGTSTLIVLAMIFVCIFATREYEATGSLQVQKESTDALGLDSLVNAASGAGDALEANINIQTQASILQSEELMLQVIKHLDLEKNDDFKPKWSIFDLLAFMQPQGKGDPANADIEQSPQKRARLVRVFSKNLKIKPLSGTRIIEIRFTNSDPKVAAAVINDLIRSLSEFNFQTRFKATENVAQWLSFQLDGLRKHSEELQSQVAQLQRESGVYSVGTTDATGREQAYSAILDRLQHGTTAVSEAEQNRILKGAVYEAAKAGDAEALSSLAGVGLPGSTSGSNSGSLSLLQNLRMQEASLRAQIEQDEAKLGAKHPRLEDERSNLAGLQKAIRDEITRVRARAENDFRIAMKHEEMTKRDYESQKRDANLMNEKAIKYVLMRQEAIDSRLIYEELSKRLTAAGILEGLHSTNITVVDGGRIPAKPSKPNVPVYMAGALFMGIVVSFCAAYVVDSIDNKVQEIADVEKRDFPLLGIVPSMSKQLLESGESPLIGVKRSPYGEAIRSLASTLLLAKSSAPPKVLLVTSAVEKEGKTTVSRDLAMCYAQQGKRVLLVDADMRRGGLSSRLGMRKSGLSLLLSSSTDAVQPGTLPGLPNPHIIPAGAVPPYPAELLNSERMRDMLQQWRAAYDIVVLDTPPLLPVVDTRALIPASDVTIQVARHRYSSRTSMDRASGIIADSGAPIVGLLLNDVNIRSTAYYGYYGYNKSSYYAEEETADANV